MLHYYHIFHYYYARTLLNEIEENEDIAKNEIEQDDKSFNTVLRTITGIFYNTVVPPNSWLISTKKPPGIRKSGN